MKKEAEAHAEEDKKKKELVDKKNDAESLIFTAEKTLKDAGEKAPADLKSEVEDKSKALKDILETGTKEDLDAKSKDLMDSLQKLGSSMYQQSQAQTPPSDQTADGDQPKPENKGNDKSTPEEGEVVN